MKKLLNRIFGRSSPMNQVRRVLERSQGGIYKRIDENRELLEHMQRYAPEYLDAHPWVAGWIKAQDEFLLELIAAAEIKPAHIHPVYVMAGEEWPRPWPERSDDGVKEK